MANPVSWFEVIGEDAVALQTFYRQVFDWKLSPPMPEMGMYSLLDHEGQGIPGGIGQGEAGQSRVTVYVEVADPQACLDRVVEAGGTMVVPVTEIPGAGVTFAMFADPAGNVVGLHRSQ